MLVAVVGFVIFIVRCLKYGLKKTFINLGKGILFIWFLLGAVFMYRAGFPVAELSDFRKKPGGRDERGKLAAGGGGLPYSSKEKRRRVTVEKGVDSYMVLNGKVVKVDETVSVESGDGVLVGAKDYFFRPKVYFLSQAREILARSSPFEDDTAAQQALVKGVFYSESFFREVCGLLEKGLVEQLPKDSEKKKSQ